VYYIEGDQALTVADMKTGEDAHSKSATTTATGFRHEVKLKDLVPGTLYSYICGNADHGWSPISSFVAPRVTNDSNIAIVGMTTESSTAKKALGVVYGQAAVERHDILIAFGEPSEHSNDWYMHSL
jgi:hypothetical protein